MTRLVPFPASVFLVFCPRHSWDGDGQDIRNRCDDAPLFLHSAMDKSHTVKLFVGNLALDTTQEELSAIFEPYGQVVSCSVLRQFAFVHLQGEGAAERAIRELSGREFRGRNLVVEESRGRPLHSTKVFVGNLSGMCTTEDLQQLFQTFGKVLECDKVKGECSDLLLYILH